LTSGEKNIFRCDFSERVDYALFSALFQGHFRSGWSKGSLHLFSTRPREKNNLGRWGNPEAKQAYARFEVEWWENFHRPVAERASPTLTSSGDKPDTTVKKVPLAFLQNAEATKTKANFTRYRLATIDFLVYCPLP